MKQHMIKISIVLFALLVLIPSSSFAVEIKTTIENKDLSKGKQSQSNKYLTAKQAYKIVKKHGENILFIDVRTRAEVEFVGRTAMVDAVIPYLTNDFENWNPKSQRYQKAINKDFSRVFEKLVAAKNMHKDSTIIFMCRSGERSAAAASIATKLGYTNAYTVVDGFEGDRARKGKDKGHRVLNGWKNSRAPWGY